MKSTDHIFGLAFIYFRIENTRLTPFFHWPMLDIIISLVIQDMEGPSHRKFAVFYTTNIQIEVNENMYFNADKNQWQSFLGERN